MNAPVQQRVLPPLQPSERAPFHLNPPTLELPTRNGSHVVVNLDRTTGPANPKPNGEASDLKHPPSPKYGSLGDDVELGPKHVSNASKDGAAEGETVCRVCHLGLTSGNSESIVLGCACKQDLALCHRDCAEEWFRIRGNTVCEICGETAKNVHIVETRDTTTSTSATRGGMELPTSGVAEGNNNNNVVQVGRPTTMTRLRYLWANQLFRNSLLATMIVVFMVPWFFRIACF